ncbi:hypothetical protein PHYPO_G00139680 [Pangasianodon hypophthalmus]|uniref:Uncharacterized protein n=1 Tax=Pangasianodon hypophthalmus TaxID=310915 RepID=A0A5N5KCR7_PANHP|nr:hypothetical protein PHYPO_G00139680 [Pangasianodon hypophthalmus]
MNLKNHFCALLDQHAPRLQNLFRKKAARTGKVAEVLDQLFRIYDLQEQVDVHVRRAAVLRALPAYLHEDDSRFLKLWDVNQHINSLEFMQQFIIHLFLCVKY